MSEKRRWMTAALLAAGIALAAPGPAAADAAADGSRHVRLIADKMIAILREQGMSRAQRARKLRPIVVRQIDIRYLGRWLVGRWWRKLSPADRAAYLRALPKYLVRTFAARLAKFHGERFVVKHAEPKAGDVVVTTDLVDKANPPPLVIKWRLHRAGDSYKVRDMVVQNISMALNLRREFTERLDHGDGKIGKLMALLEGEPRRKQAR